jgi:hypothetical protein
MRQLVPIRVRPSRARFAWIAVMAVALWTIGGPPIIATGSGNGTHEQLEAAENVLARMLEAQENLTSFDLPATARVYVGGRKVLTASIRVSASRPNHVAVRWLGMTIHPRKGLIFVDPEQFVSGDYTLAVLASPDCLQNATQPTSNPATVTLLDMGTGRVWMEVTAPKALFYAVISEMSGLQVAGDSDVIRMMRDLTFAKREYDKVAVALEQVKATGYGIVTPFLEEIYFAEPDIIRQGNRCGVRLKAMAPSIHMIRADIKTEVTPLMGTEKQSEEFAEQIAEDFAENPSKIWETEFLGRSMQDLIREGIEAKLAHMPVHAQEKLQETLQKIVNEGSGGLICIVL